MKSIRMALHTSHGPNTLTRDDVSSIPAGGEKAGEFLRSQAREL